MTGFRRPRALAMLVAVVLLVLARSAAAYPGEAYVLSARALEAYRDGRFDEARELFAKAAKKAPAAKALLELGVGSAQYRAGDREEAAQTFRDIFDSSRPDVTAAAQFNAGVVEHRKAQEALQSLPGAQAGPTTPSNASTAQSPGDADPRQKAIAALEQALKDYRIAIEKVPGDVDMIYNYELALRQLEELKKEPPPPPQAQQDQKAEDQQDKPENQQEQQQPQSQPDSNRGDENKQDQKEQQRPPEQNQTQQQPEQENKPEQGQPDEQKKDEPKPHDSHPPSQQQPPQRGDGGGQQPPPKPGEMSPEDVQRLLNALPEGDQKALQRLFNARHQIRGDMEKDW